MLKKILISILIFAIYFSSFSQTQKMENEEKIFAGYQSHNFCEKIFVHTDKTFYLAGETIWFKAYNVDCNFHKPASFSKVIYVDIISNDQKNVLQGKIEMDSGSGNGSFIIPSSLISGNYILRAYTSWMKNFSADFYFEQPLTIINTLKPPVQQKEIQKNDSVYIQFFPEGGNLVYGLNSKIAFKVADQNGNGIDCGGIIINQNKDTVVAFKTLHDGMGSFYFTPKPNELYKPFFTINNVSVASQLPKMYDKGFVMNLMDADSDNIKIIVSSTADFNNQQVFLFVHSNQLIKSVQVNSINDGKAFFIINKKILSDGISHITIFNADKKPMCERLYYNKPINKMIINAQINQADYNQRQQVNITVQSTDQLNKPVKANLSMSVFMIDSLQSIPQENIYNYLLLTSELKGKIESPQFYFENTGTDTDEATDNLMLTQGWRRFKWDDILQDKKTFFEFIPEVEGLLINGKIVDKRSGETAANKTAYLSIPGKYFEFKSAVSDKNGTVHFNPNNFYGNNEIILLTNGLTDSNYRVEIANPYSEIFSSAVLPGLYLSKKWKKLLEYRSLNIQADNSYLIEKKHRYLTPEIKDTTPFYGNPERRYYLDDFTRFTTMEEVMREFVLDVRVRKQADKFSFFVMNDLFNTYFEDNPIVLIDGLPVFDINKIMGFDPLKIKRIDVVAHKYIAGSLTTDGIITYNTYNGDLAGFELDPNAIVLQYEGLQQQREFYAPVYKNKDQSNMRIPDFRNVLQWLPEIKTDEKNKKQLSFYTSDLTGKFAIIIQGISGEGLPGYTISTITVNK